MRSRTSSAHFKSVVVLQTPGIQVHQKLLPLVQGSSLMLFENYLNKFIGICMDDELGHSPPLSESDSDHLFIIGSLLFQEIPFAQRQVIESELFSLFSFSRGLRY